LPIILIVLDFLQVFFGGFGAVLHVDLVIFDQR